MANCGACDCFTYCPIHRPAPGHISIVNSTFQIRTFYTIDYDHDNKGFSEEKCVRCGWVMGHPALNCQNDNTPHVFPSQIGYGS